MVPNVPSQHGQRQRRESVIEPRRRDCEGRMARCDSLGLSEAIGHVGLAGIFRIAQCPYFDGLTIAAVSVA